MAEVAARYWHPAHRASFWDGLGYGILGGSIGAFSGMVLAGAAHGLAKAWGALQD